MPRRKRDTREELFERVAAAKCYIGTIRNAQHAEVAELAAFMSIFHPEHELTKAPPCKLRNALGQ